MDENSTISSGEPQVLFSTGLTEDQVRIAIIEFLLKNEELKQKVEGRSIDVHTRWQTTRWSHPDEMVHVFFTEAAKDSETGPSENRIQFAAGEEDGSGA